MKFKSDIRVVLLQLVSLSIGLGAGNVGLSQIVPQSTLSSLARSQFEFDTVMESSADPSLNIENSGEPSLKIDDKTKEKTLEARFENLEKSYKKDKEAAAKKKEEDAKKEKKWFEKYTVRGYAEVQPMTRPSL